MSKKSKLTLIIDGNWLLISRYSVIANKFSTDEQMCKELQLLMLKSIGIVTKTFSNIDNIIFVSDGGSWRSHLEIPSYLYDEKTSEDQSVEYKGQRHLPEGTNWDLVFKYYEELISMLQENGITTCRSIGIEGDDWCWYWSNKLNNDGTNVIIWSMDKDLTQLVRRNKENGVFTICWNMKTGATVENINEEENPLDFFFNDLNLEFNNQLYDSIIEKCKNVNSIYPKDIIIDKIIRGDKGDNIFPIILKHANNAASNKTFRVSMKDIDFNLDLNNDTAIRNYIHGIVNSKKYINKVSKSEDNIFNHFKYNYKLVVLEENNYPQEVLDTMNSYIGYTSNNNVSNLISYVSARNNSIDNILEAI